MKTSVTLSCKIFSCLLLFLLLSVSVGAQAQIPGTAILTGKVTNPKIDSVAVSLRDNPLNPRERLFVTKLNAEGEFTLTLPVTHAVPADLVYGEDVAPLYLDPGTDLDVRFRGEDMSNSVKFRPNKMPASFSTHIRNGANLTPEERHRVQAANANSYLTEADATFVENDGFQVLPDNIQLYEVPFLSFLEYRRKHELIFLEDRAAKQSFTPEFYNYAKAEIAYSYANDRLTYPDLREQVVNTEGRLKLSTGYYDFLKDPNLINDFTASQSEQCHEFLLNYIHYVTGLAQHQRTDVDFYTQCFNIGTKVLAGPSKPIILGRILEESFRFGHVKQSEALLAAYKPFDAKNRYLPTLEADFSQRKVFALGAPAPAFRLVSAAGDSVSMKDFIGKVVYVNFWKTNSNLCLRDLVYAQDLCKKFEGKSIAFVNICLDDKPDAWKQMVVSRKLPGVHLFAPGGLTAPLARQYALQDVPAYFLIGEDGTFLNTKPKRLSSHALIEELTQSFGKAGVNITQLTK